MPSGLLLLTAGTRVVPANLILPRRSSRGIVELAGKGRQLAASLPWLGPTGCLQITTAEAWRLARVLMLSPGKMIAWQCSLGGRRLTGVAAAVPTAFGHHACAADAARQHQRASGCQPRRRRRNLLPHSSWHSHSSLRVRGRVVVLAMSLQLCRLMAKTTFVGHVGERHNILHPASQLLFFPWPRHPAKETILLSTRGFVPV